MNKIDTETFRFIWEQIESKLEQIAKIPKLYSPNGRGKDYVGFDIDNAGVTYKTETYFSCGDTEPESFTIEWHEMNKDLEYFKTKFQKEIDDFNAKRDEEKRIEDEAKLAYERKEYERLKAKFESNERKSKEIAAAFGVKEAEYEISTVTETGYEQVQAPFRKNQDAKA